MSAEGAKGSPSCVRRSCTCRWPGPTLRWSELRRSRTSRPRAHASPRRRGLGGPAEVRPTVPLPRGPRRCRRRRPAQQAARPIGAAGRDVSAGQRAIRSLPRAGHPRARTLPGPAGAGVLGHPPDWRWHLSRAAMSSRSSLRATAGPTLGMAVSGLVMSRFSMTGKEPSCRNRTSRRAGTDGAPRRHAHGTPPRWASST